MTNELATTRPIKKHSFPMREDCWTEEATSTLISAWGDRHLELNRGNLRQKHWQLVADAVNRLHHNHNYNGNGDGTKVLRRTDVQCKNRIDTLKKKYKLERTRVTDSGGGYVSQWVFYDRLDHLIGAGVGGAGAGRYGGGYGYEGEGMREVVSAKKKKGVREEEDGMGVNDEVMLALMAQTGEEVRKVKNPRISLRKEEVVKKEVPEMLMLPRLPTYIPSGPRSRRRSARVVAGGSPFTRCYSSGVMEDDEFRGFKRGYLGIGAARNAAVELGEEKRKGSEGGVGEDGMEGIDGVRDLAKAIVKFGEVYERMEDVRQKQVMELERQRMEHLKNMEFQRMQMFVDWQVQLEKIKRPKRASASAASDSYN